jgi:hypothetical protein
MHQPKAAVDCHTSQATNSQPQLHCPHAFIDVRLARFLLQKQQFNPG